MHIEEEHDRFPVLNWLAGTTRVPIPYTYFLRIALTVPNNPIPIPSNPQLKILANLKLCFTEDYRNSLK